MKKSIFAVALMATIGLGTFTSCSSEVRTDETTETHGQEAYTCPMTECEDGKKYPEAGTCPVCKMDLVKVD